MNGKKRTHRSAVLCHAARIRRCRRSDAGSAEFSRGGGSPSPPPRVLLHLLLPFLSSWSSGGTVRWGMVRLAMGGRGSHGGG